jgi:hypothetical protein
MSILNTASDGLFNVLIILVRLLTKCGPQSRDNILVLAGGRFGAIDSSKINMSLVRWTELGLFVETDSLIGLADRHKKALSNNPDIAESRLPKVLRSLIFSPENNVRFWSSEENRSADCTRGIAWLLAQNIYALDTSSHKPINELESAQILDESRRMFQNDVRWNGVKMWCSYLGFARQGSSMVIDPTPALRESLDDIFVTERMAALDFVSRASEVLPVLDGGSYRSQIEEFLRDTNWTAPPNGFVSTSLSRAIRRLTQEGWLAQEELSDPSSGVKLLGHRNESWGLMTHVRRLPKDGVA